MSDTKTQLPIGIRLNNPANLRQAHGPDQRTIIVDGYASFGTMRQGVSSLFWWIHSLYRHQGRTTLREITAQLAPATTNDLATYERELLKRLRLNPLKVTTQDMGLDDPWRAIDLARAIIWVENGAAPSSFGFSEEWISPYTLVCAMLDTRKWTP
jgi:hypothetical protein